MKGQAQMIVRSDFLEFSGLTEEYIHRELAVKLIQTMPYEELKKAFSFSKDSKDSKNKPKPFENKPTTTYKAETIKSVTIGNINTSGMSKVLGMNKPSGYYADSLEAAKKSLGKVLLQELLETQTQVIALPSKFAGVKSTDLKRIFEKHGIQLEP